MNILGGSEVRNKQFTPFWTNFCDTKPEWTTRKTCTVTWNSMTISRAAQTKIRNSAQQKIARRMQMVMTCWLLTGGSFALFSGKWGVLWNCTGTKRKIGYLLVTYGYFRENPTVCTCLLSSEGWNSFPRHQDIALAPKKDNEGVKKQWSAQ